VVPESLQKIDQLKKIYIYIYILTEKMGEKNLKKNWFKNQNHPDSISEN
jgi:hypothetical protein